MEREKERMKEEKGERMKEEKVREDGTGCNLQVKVLNDQEKTERERERRLIQFGETGSEEDGPFEREMKRGWKVK